MINKAIRVVLVDDQLRIHQAVETVLRGAADISLVGQGSNGKEAVQLCQQLKPDILLLDVMMPVMDGIEACKQIHEAFPEIYILVLSSLQDDEKVFDMLHHGAAGYILKGALASDLVNAIRATYSGQSVVSHEIMEKLLRKPKPDQDFGLTSREMEVLKLMASGLQNKEIAAELIISESTVKFHLANVQAKLGVETRAEVIAIAAKNNMI